MAEDEQAEYQPELEVKEESVVEEEPVDAEDQSEDQEESAVEEEKDEELLSSKILY